MSNNRRELEPGATRAADRLGSWKEIAAHLQRDIRTVHRWESQEGLPIHRQMHTKGASVYAYRSELNAWRSNRVAPGSRTTGRRLMLAVLPFVNLIGDPEQDYLSDGFTEEMLAQLGRVNPERLGVIARTSVMRYKRSPKPIDVIGRELGVDYVLEGSVRRAAERVRVTAQLIRVSDQSHLWAECYDRALDDVLLLQSEVALAIARQIRVVVTPDGSTRLAGVQRVNAAAFEASLKGRFHWYKLSREHLDLAQEYFQFALEKDPGHAAAYAGLAYVWFSRGDCGFIPAREAYSQAKAAASKALELGDALAQVHELLAVVKLHLDWDWTDAESELLRAIELDPNYADAHFIYADILMSIGRCREAMAQMRQALTLDPFNFLFRCFFGWHLVYLRRYDEAIAELDTALRTEPGYPAAHLGRWGAFWQKGRYGEALEAAQKFFELLGDREVVDAMASGWAEGGYTRAMHTAADTLVRRSHETHVPAIRIARLYAHAGVTERTLDWLEHAYTGQESPLVHVRVAWDWDRVRAHPRFQDLVRRMNFPDAIEAQ